MKMTVTISLGTLVKVVLALTVALTVIVMLLTDGARQNTQGPTEVPPTVDVRADR
jgi:hypothetical protein